MLNFILAFAASFMAAMYTYTENENKRLWKRNEELENQIKRMTRERNDKFEM